jgi:hypothetical protein
LGVVTDAAKVAAPHTPIPGKGYGEFMHSEKQEMVKFYFVITLVSTFIITSLMLLGFYMYFGFSSGFWVKILQDHFSTLVVIPFGAGFSLVVVILLGATQGPIEFEAIGLKFRGASGPIVLWCLVFLSLMASVRILW